MKEPREIVKEKLNGILAQIRGLDVSGIDANNATPEQAQRLLSAYAKIMDGVFQIVEDELREARAAHQSFMGGIDVRYPNKPIPPARLKKSISHLTVASEIAGSLSSLLLRSSAMASIAWREMQARQRHKN